MFRKLFPVVVFSLWGMVFSPLPQAFARVPLTQAEIQYLRRSVRLMPRNRPKRWARLRDRMIPGDGLSTGRASLADLRFNDGSLARVGQQAIFYFQPRTRNFRLGNGTVLLLIPPGRGKTRINTPNAAAAIRGSALFVRYDKETDTTIVGALTDSGIEVSNKDQSQTQELKAGQLIIIIKDRIKSLYDFDLRTFYETSELVKNLNLNKQDTTIKDPAIASVKKETTEALKEQTPIEGKEVVANPPQIRLTNNSPQITDPYPERNTTIDPQTGDVIRPIQPTNPQNNTDTQEPLPTITPATVEPPTVEPQPEPPTPATPTVEPQPKTPTVEPQPEIPTVEPQPELPTTDRDVTEVPEIEENPTIPVNEEPPSTPENEDLPTTSTEENPVGNVDNNLPTTGSNSPNSSETPPMSD